MRNYEQELENRVSFIRQLLKESSCEGIVYGNSGGKDSALVGILCKKACSNTVGILLPCATTQNYGSDTDDAIRVAEQFGIAYRTVDLSETRGALVAALEKAGVELNNAAVSNIAPRLRMTALYAVAAAEHRLVAGTGNRSEAFMGYCTKWGDAAADFNPIADLSVTEVFEFLDYLDAPETIRHKAPSAGLFEGQTDEKEMGVSYAAIDRYMDGIYISEKIGAAKPSAKLFEHALRDLGITNRSRVLVVGDDLLADIKGGINAGVDTCWYNPRNVENKTDIAPKFTVGSYEELYRIVMEPEELENLGVRNRRHSNEALL